MAQFTYYTASDASAPTLTGESGSLISLLEATLVTGYGSKPGAGWTMPYPTSSNVGCFRQGTGSMTFLRVIDSAVTTSREAQITGFDTMSSVTVGNNPFPAIGQGILGGSSSYLIARKSATITSAARAWKVFADSSSAYVYIASGDVAGTYLAFFFGDFYSFNPAVDKNRSMIIGRIAENNAATTNDKLDVVQTTITANPTGHHAAHTFGEMGIGSIVSVHGDGTKASSILAGSVVYPNTVDSGIYMSPVWVNDIIGPNIRGTMKGFYQILHPITNFIDGQEFSGSGAYSSKIFMILKQSGNAGVYCMETSDTLDTN